MPSKLTFATKASPKPTRKRGLLNVVSGPTRTGKLFCGDWDGSRGDILIVGKALGGGVYPVSAILANDEVMQVIRPGDHGSTFGGNPLGAAVGRAALAVLVDEELPRRSRELGAWYAERLGEIDSPHIDHIRGRGLMIGVVIKESSGAARPFCEALMERGILCNDTHHQTIRIAPPLVVTKEILEETLPVFEEVTSGVGVAV